MPVNIKKLPSVKYLNECFNVCFEKGVLHWKERPLHHFLNNASRNRWVTLYANKIVNPALNKGYQKVWINNTPYAVHRIIFKMHNGSEPKIVDHINQCRCDNRIANLRAASPQQNCMNKKVVANSKTGINGVHHSGYGGFRVRTKHKNKVVNLGTFDDFFEACCVRKSAEMKNEFYPNGRTA